MIRIFRAIVSAGVIAAAAPGAAQVVPVGAAGLLAMVGQGQYGKARDALRAAEHTDVDVLFLEAQILAHQGRLSEAVAAYRAILAANPGLTPVRQILAQTLFNMGDYDAARFHFRTLMEAEPNPDLRVQYANALRVIEQQIPSGINASFAIRPSTNINRGTYNTSFQAGALNFTIDPTSRQVSGVGLQVGVNGYYRIPVSDSAVVTLSAGASQTIYEDDSFNVTQPYASVAYTKNAAQSTWTGSVFVNRAYRDAGNHVTSYGLQYSARRQVNGPYVLTYSAVAQQADYDTQPTQTGQTYSFDLGIQQQVNPTTSLSAGLKLARGLPESDAFKYWSTSAYAGVSRNWRGGWSGFMGVEVGGRRYDDNFTALTFARDDEFVTLSGSLLNSTISYAGFAPRLNCSLQINSSNVAFYDYNATECSFELTRGF